MTMLSYDVNDNNV